MAKRQPASESHSLTLLKFFRVSSPDNPDADTQEEMMPMPPEGPHTSARPSRNPSSSTEEEPPMIVIDSSIPTEQPSTDTSAEEPEVSPIVMDSQDSRPSEHPSASDATAAASVSVGQLHDI